MCVCGRGGGGVNNYYSRSSQIYLIRGRVIQMWAIIQGNSQEVVCKSLITLNAHL